MNRPFVFIVSPFGTTAGGSQCTPEQKKRNINYLDRCIRDSLYRGEAPFAGHKMYCPALDDESANERNVGIESAWEYLLICDIVAVYSDYGITIGMQKDIAKSNEIGHYISWRRIGIRERGDNAG